MMYRILTLTPFALKLTLLVLGLVVNDAGQSIPDQVYGSFSDNLATAFATDQEGMQPRATNGGATPYDVLNFPCDF